MLKDKAEKVFKDTPDAIECFSKIESILFDYNNKAKQIEGAEEHGVDDDIHYGVKAQDLETNPLTESVVEEDAEGNKLVNTEELTMANTSVIAEICRRLKVIEDILQIKVEK